MITQLGTPHGVEVKTKTQLCPHPAGEFNTITQFCTLRGVELTTVTQVYGHKGCEVKDDNVVLHTPRG